LEELIASSPTWESVSREFVISYSAPFSVRNVRTWLLRSPGYEPSVAYW